LFFKERFHYLGSFSSETASELDVLGLDGNSLGMDGSQVGVFKETDKVGFGGLLQGTDGRGLETEIGLEVLGDFTDKTLEGQFSDQKLGGFLVSSDFSEGNSTGSVSVGFLDSTGSGGRLSGSLGGELFSRGFSTSGLSCGLLSSGHFDLDVRR